MARVNQLGTLQICAPADVSIPELVEQPVDFVDARKNARRGQRWLKPVLTRARHKCARAAVADAIQLAMKGLTIGIEDLQ